MEPKLQENPIDNIIDNETPQNDKKLEEALIPVITNKKMSTAQKVQQIVEIVRYTEMYSGPIPPPNFLKGYQEVIPDAPERILKMAENAQAAQIEGQREILKQNGLNITNSHKANKSSQIFAFILIVCLIAAGIWITVTGHDTVGGMIFGTTIVGVATVFIVGKIKDRKSEDSK